MCLYAVHGYICLHPHNCQSPCKLGYDRVGIPPSGAWSWIWPRSVAARVDAESRADLIYLHIHGHWQAVWIQLQPCHGSSFNLRRILVIAGPLMYVLQDWCPDSKTLFCPSGARRGNEEMKVGVKLS
jgi:hypothetical protein